MIGDDPSTGPLPSFKARAHIMNPSRVIDTTRRALLRLAGIGAIAGAGLGALGGGTALAKDLASTTLTTS
jgi:hypothetical protein